MIAGWIIQCESLTRFFFFSLSSAPPEGATFPCQWSRSSKPHVLRVGGSLVTAQWDSRPLVFLLSFPPSLCVVTRRLSLFSPFCPSTLAYSPFCGWSSNACIARPDLRPLAPTPRSETPSRPESLRSILAYCDGGWIDELTAFLPAPLFCVLGSPTIACHLALPSRSCLILVVFFFFFFRCRSMSRWGGGGFGDL